MSFHVFFCLGGAAKLADKGGASFGETGNVKVREGLERLDSFLDGVGWDLSVFVKRSLEFFEVEGFFVVGTLIDDFLHFYPFLGSGLLFVQACCTNHKRYI